MCLKCTIIQTELHRRNVLYVNLFFLKNPTDSGRLFSLLFWIQHCRQCPSLFCKPYFNFNFHYKLPRIFQHFFQNDIWCFFTTLVWLFIYHISIRRFPPPPTEYSSGTQEQDPPDLLSPVNIIRNEISFHVFCLPTCHNNIMKCHRLNLHFTENIFFL